MRASPVCALILHVRVSCMYAVVGLVLVCAYNRRCSVSVVCGFQDVEEMVHLIAPDLKPPITGVGDATADVSHELVMVSGCRVAVQGAPCGELSD